MKDSDYKLLCGEESHGTYGSWGIKILVAGSNLPDFDHKKVWNASHKAMELLESEIRSAGLETNEEAQSARREERAQLVGLFDQPIYVEEIPNGYCSQWCCRHLPWFVVTTPIGRIKIGWRKRVIHIDWSQTNGTPADDLFRNENVTKGKQYIHAWSAEKAREYISAIMNSAQRNGQPCGEQGKEGTV